MQRRNFIRISSLTSGGWLLSQMIPVSALAKNAEPACFQPSPLIRVCDNGKVILFVAKQESGQGVQTSLPLIIAEEMEVDPKDIVIQALPFNSDPKQEGAYSTGGSTSVPFEYDSLRKAGAAAREMLLAAAAAKWGVPVANLRADRSKIINTITGEELNYSELYAAASKLEVPKNPTLKNYKDFKLIGKPGQKKTNIKSILTGKMSYSIDVKVPGMLYGSVVHCPVYGGKAISWDETSIAKIEGVVKIVEIKQMDGGVSNHAGVGIIATNRWSALKAQQRLKVKWDLGENAKLSSGSYSKLMQTELLKKGELVLNEQGKPGTITATDATWVKGNYELPFLAHATLEPVNCIAAYKNGSFELWGGFQTPGKVVSDCGKYFGVSPDKIFINLAMMGGGFGRKLNVDYAGIAMQLAKTVDKPVQLMYTRADDIKYGTFRTASAHTLSAKVGSNGLPETLQSQTALSPGSDFYDGKIVDTSLDYCLNGGFEGDMIYAIPKVNGSGKRVTSPLPTAWWRAVNFTHNTFILESFIDELAIKSKTDPLEYRLQLLAPLQPMTQKGFISYNPRRMENVLKLAASKIDWTAKRKPGTGVGIACCFYNHAKAYTAHAVEVEIVAKTKQVKLLRAVVATDIGIVIDPDGLRNQIEGGFIWGLSATLKSAITFTNGVADQSSYFDFEVVRMGNQPPLEIVVVNSAEAPGGAGETSVPSVFAAVTNAIAHAGGGRVRQLPLTKAGWTTV